MRMRTWPALAGLVVALSFPVLAQHAGHAGGGGGRAAAFASHPSAPSISHGPIPVSSRPPIVRNSPVRGGYPAPRAVSSRPNPYLSYGAAYGRSGTRPVNTAAHVNNRSRSANSSYGNRRRPDDRIRIYATPISPLGWWLGPYQFYPWLDADLSYDYWHDTGDMDTAIATASTGADMVADAPPFPNGGDPYAEQAEDDDAPANWTATQLDTGAPALTLVYKSGRTEQVANYVVSPSAVTVIDDSGVRSVPIADLDVMAMAKVNAQAGLTLPQALQQ